MPKLTPEEKKLLHTLSTKNHPTYNDLQSLKEILEKKTKTKKEQALLEKILDEMGQILTRKSLLEYILTTYPLTNTYEGILIGQSLDNLKKIKKALDELHNSELLNNTMSYVLFNNLEALNYDVYPPSLSNWGSKIIYYALKTQAPKLLSRSNVSLLSRIEKDSLPDILLILDSLIQMSALDNKTFQYIIQNQNYLKGHGCEIVAAFKAMNKAGIPLFSGNVQFIMDVASDYTNLEGLTYILNRINRITNPKLATEVLQSFKSKNNNGLAFNSDNFKQPQYLENLSYCVNMLTHFCHYDVTRNVKSNIRKLLELNPSQVLYLAIILKGSLVQEKGGWRMALNNQTLNHIFKHKEHILTKDKAVVVAHVFKKMSVNNIPLPGNRKDLINLSIAKLQNLHSFLSEYKTKGHSSLELDEFKLLRKNAAWLLFPEKRRDIIRIINVMNKAGINLARGNHFKSLLMLPPSRLHSMVILLSSLQKYDTLNYRIFEQTLNNSLKKETKNSYNYTAYCIKLLNTAGIPPAVYNDPRNLDHTNFKF